MFLLSYYYIIIDHQISYPNARVIIFQNNKETNRLMNEIGVCQLLAILIELVMEK